jgi:hypothetical protein
MNVKTLLDEKKKFLKYCKTFYFGIKVLTLGQIPFESEIARLKQHHLRSTFKIVTILLG